MTYGLNIGYISYISHPVILNLSLLLGPVTNNCIANIKQTMCFLTTRKEKTSPRGSISLSLIKIKPFSTPLVLLHATEQGEVEDGLASECTSGQRNPGTLQFLELRGSL